MLNKITREGGEGEERRRKGRGEEEERKRRGKREEKKRSFYNTFWSVTWVGVADQRNHKSAQSSQIGGQTRNNIFFWCLKTRHCLEPR